MRRLLMALIAGVWLGTAACASEPPPPVAPCEAMQLPLKMIVLVYPEWKDYVGDDQPVAYVLLIGKRDVTIIEGKDYRSSPGLLSLVAEYDRPLSPIPVLDITLDVVRKDVL